MTLTYLLGLIATAVVLYQRVGFPEIKAGEGVGWREFLLWNIPWFVLTLAKIWFWFAVLAVWLIQGKPASTWKAVTEKNGRSVRKIVRTA